MHTATNRLLSFVFLILAWTVGFDVFAVTAFAAAGKCILRVDGKTYLNGACDISLIGGGSFIVSTMPNINPSYFAYVNLDSTTPGSATGSWNGKEAESHAHDTLGTLTRKGACWSNARATVCAVAR